MAETLTPQQHQAVHDRGGKLLVSAAAGSGKTKVLVDRLLTYLTDPADPANLDDFLIITYTKAAASELRGKIAARLTKQIAKEPENRHLQKQMQRLYLTQISTVHGFCGDLLREYAYRLDLSADFRVADENECRELRETVLSDLLDRAYETAAENADFRAFIDSQGLGRDDRLVPQIIETVYDSARCHLNPQQWLDQCVADAQADDCADVSETAWGSFLIADLRDYLDCQIAVLAQCVRQLEHGDRMEKPTVVFRDILLQLQALREAQDWDSIVKLSAIDYGRLSFPRKDVDFDLIERVKAARNACKKGLDKKLHSFSDSSLQIWQDLSQCAAGVRGLIALVCQFDRDFSAAKRSRRILDFSDLEHKALDLLLGKSRSGSTAAAAEISQRFREILVDEYQDSNGVQDAIFDALTQKKQNCFLVGDVKQSIYRFRLADPGIFLQKYHDYVPAEQALPKQGRKVLLSHNFRSGGEVIEGVNDVFRACMRPKVGGLHYGEGEALREGISHETLPEPGVELCVLDIQEETYPEEAAYVADRIQAMLQKGTWIRGEQGFRPVVPEDIVILLRSPGSAGIYFQRALEARGIRCASGSGTDLLQTQEIATLRAFLEVIVNPRQDIPLLSTLASPIFGFTADDLAAIRSGRRKQSFFDALLESGHPKARYFLDTLDILRWEARMNTLTGLLESCFRLTRLDSIYGAMADGDAKAANLQIFYQLASDFEKGSLRNLSQFLDHLRTLEARGMVMSNGAANGGVTIMSIHKSKGLEFPVVFLSNLSRKFNQEDLRAQILCDRELGLGFSVADTQNRIRYPSIAKAAIAAKMTAESISEELRVLYVAMTRARDRLIMTYAVKNPEKDLMDVAMRMDFDGGELLCRDAICMGDWVLLAAMGKTEAGALHALGGKPAHTTLGTHPWKITLETVQPTAHEGVLETDAAMKIPAEALETLKTALDFHYTHLPAIQAPSKQTATDRKGRIKDAEAAENTQEPSKPLRKWRRPSFLSPEPGGRTYGNALHAALQYIRYENCTSSGAVCKEIARLAELGFLTRDQADMVKCDQIAAFFRSDLGEKLRTGTPYLREFKFSILDDGRNYGEGLEGEQVLLQGVVDCALLEPDGITVIDFKTDHVTLETLSAAVERYRPQILTYGEALSRIYESEIKARYLYFFRLNRFVEV